MKLGNETRDRSDLPQPLLLPLIVLLGLTLATQLAALAYNTEQSFASIVLPSIVALTAVTLPLAALGLWLGGQIGLGAPLLNDLLQNRSGSMGKLLQDVVLAMGLGLAVGILLLLLRFLMLPYLPAELPPLGHRGALGGLLVAISAAIGEEIWLRLGVMTIIAWLIMRLSGSTKLKPGIAWVAILIAALGFGLIHLPQLNAAGAADPIGIIGTMAGNTLVGTLCGWLYWRRSLMAAILAHFGVDLVLHVVAALLP